MRISLRSIVLLLLAVAIAAALPVSAYAQPESPAKIADPSTAPAPAPDRIAEPSTTPAPDKIGTPAQLGEPADKSMETALIAIKSLIDIDDDVFTEFSYSSGYSNYEKREGLIWSFSWYNAKSANIYASVKADGVVLQYAKYNFEENGFGFAKIAKSAAIAIADGFIKKANPDTYSCYKAPNSVYADIRSGEYRIAYFADINGYNFEAAQITVNVNKFSGEVTGYSASGVNPGKYRFEDAEGLITKNDAAAAYAEKIGLNLEYRSYYDYEESSFKVFPVYLLDSGSDKYIGAKTGDVVTYVYDPGADDSYLYGEGGPSPQPEMAADAGSGGSRASLTPAEIAAIEQVAKFITSEQALSKLLDTADLSSLDVGSFSEKYIGLNRDYIEKNRYFYDISLYKYSDYGAAAEDEITGFYGRVDASTGRVLSFSMSYMYPGSPIPSSQKAITEAQAEASVTAFLKKVAPGELAKSKLEITETPVVVPYYYRGGEFFFSYVRYQNDIPYRDNAINVAVNMYTGKITSYSLIWYDSITFPGIGGVLTQQQALTGYVAQSGAEIKYITTGDGNAAIVYEFIGHKYIDPFTGKALDYTGELWEDSAVTPDYSDVAGHWSESYVSKLLDNGVFMWSGKFEPNKVMTELEFLQYLMLIEPYAYMARVDAQAYFTQRGVKVEASPDKLLTRQEAVRIIVDYLGYGKLAGHYQWFVYPFTDSVDDAYRGYITICYMLGIINGDGGRFNASSSVTRAHAAVMLHNLVPVLNPA